MVSYFEYAFSFRIQFSLYEHSSPALWIRTSATGNHKTALYLKAESGKALLLTPPTFSNTIQLYPCVVLNTLFQLHWYEGYYPQTVSFCVLI
jgi:hypothetical protein